MQAGNRKRYRFGASSPAHERARDKPLQIARMIALDFRTWGQRRFGEPRDDPRLRTQVVAGRLGKTARAMNARCAVFHADRLRPVACSPTSVRQNIGDLTVLETGPVELRENLDGQMEPPPRRYELAVVRDRPARLPPNGNFALPRPSAHAERLRRS